MTDQLQPGGLARIGTDQVARVGYGAMQLDEKVSTDDASAVLRRALELGVNHIDTASFYAGGEVNHRIRKALAPYRDELVIVSKVGAAYTGVGPVPLTAAQKPAELRAAVESDLRQLGLTPCRWSTCGAMTSVPPRPPRAIRTSTSTTSWPR